MGTDVDGDSLAAAAAAERCAAAAIDDFRNDAEGPVDGDRLLRDARAPALGARAPWILYSEPSLLLPLSQSLSSSDIVGAARGISARRATWDSRSFPVILRTVPSTMVMGGTGVAEGE